MGDKSKLIERMRYWCDSANLGYDQSNRWDIRVGGECDCSSLVYWVLWESGYLQKPTGNLYSHTLYTGTLQRDLLAAGFAKLPNNGAPQPGDILLNDKSHVAICTGANGQLSYASIDERGHATGGASGDQTNRETKTTGYYNYPWNNYYRPPSSGSTPAPSPSPAPSGNLNVDGYWGPLTTRKLQAVLGTTQDGVVSGQYAGDFNAVDRGGLQRDTWKLGSGGSDVIAALQRKVGVNADRYFGPNTCRALQRYLGTTQDGVVSGPSDVVMALQRRLNNGSL